MKHVVALLAVMLVTGCGPKAEQQKQSLSTFDVEPAPAAQPAPAAATAPQPIAVSVPQMAYVYRYGFRLPDGAIKRAQDAHVALCDRLGPARCQVLALSSGGGEGEASGASLKLRVAAGIARPFGRQLQAAVSQAGGRSVSTAIAAEDVSKEIVDTEARLRQRTLLVERLTAILRTRTGKVSELVEAERSVAAAQEEIDQAMGWLAALRGRVAMSTVEIGYEAVSAPAADSAGSRLGDAVAQSLGGFVTGIGVILTIAILLAPWALLVALGWLGWRRFGHRLRRRHDDAAPD